MSFVNEVFSKDVYRYYGTHREPLLKRLFRSLELRYLYYLRRCNQTGMPKLLVYYYKIRLRLLSHKTHIQIGRTAKIGEGFFIGHYGRIIINYQAELGRNVNVAPGLPSGKLPEVPEKARPSLATMCGLAPMPWLWAMCISAITC